MKFVTLKSFDKKKLLIPTFIITSLILVITIFVSHAEFTSTDHVTIVDGVINYTPYDFKMMAMYEQKEGCEDPNSDACYTEVNAMPSEGYSINQDKSYCFVDDDNEKIKGKVYTNSKGEHVISDLSKRSKCILYFQEEKLTAATLIAKHVCVEPAETITEEQAKNCLVNENGYRFEGTDPNNYVRFNNEEWRIIGIFEVESEDGPEQLIKIIRTESEEKAWDESDSNNWERPATLNTYLNDTYLNTIGEKDKIASVKWNIGASDYKQTAEAVYTNETKSKTTNKYKVGLMSASDYGYAALNNTCKRTITLFDYAGSGCSDKDWLFNRNKTWTLAPSSSNTSNVLYVFNSGYVIRDSADYGYGARPSVYLKSNISLSVGSGSGDPGSSTNPYIVESSGVVTQPAVDSGGSSVEVN